MQQAGLSPNVVSFSTLMAHYCREGDMSAAEFTLSRCATRAWRPICRCVYARARASSLDGSAHAQPVHARGVFARHDAHPGDAADSLRRRPKAHNTLIDGWCSKGEVVRAWAHLRAMPGRGYRPNGRSFVPFVKLERARARGRARDQAQAKGRQLRARGAGACVGGRHVRARQGGRRRTRSCTRTHALGRLCGCRARRLCREEWALLCATSARPAAPRTSAGTGAGARRAPGPSGRQQGALIINYVQCFK